MSGPEPYQLLLTASAFAAILALAEVLRRWDAGEEATRKLVHVLSGFVAAAFPWLFTSAWSVVLLSAGYVALMAWTRQAGLLRSVHGVARRTNGGLYYPIAVGLVFLLARDRPEAYLASILVLAVGDAAAALVGRAYGVTRYRIGAETKSVEGSVAFFVCALGCVHVPLLLLTPLPPVALLLWSVHVAVLATCIEAMAPEGSDNLLIPLVCCLTLLHTDAVSAPVGGLALLALLAAGAVLAASRRVSSS